MGVTPLRSLYQLKITLADSKPPIWRRVLVRSSLDLGDLHYVVQIAMGWTDSHLHCFCKGRDCYGPASEGQDDFGEPGFKDEEEVRISKLLKREKDHITYEYDFGDGWRHEILLEKILPDDGSVPFATCVTGRRACPPEDCGGIWGYGRLLQLLQDPSDPEYEETLEWVGEGFDPDLFDKDEVNELFREVSED